ncbi:MAG: 1,2-phenylacetyl-CoA epoxidase subunit PaaC [Flavitalea sp.]
MAFTDYILHLADNALILGHRNSEWTGHGPILEQDIALSNISLDLIGQARNFYQYAAELSGENSTEDTLAFFRDAPQYKNCLLLEQENGDWGKTIMRQFLYSAYAYPLYTEAGKTNDTQLVGIAEKSLKEVTYHLRWSSEWVIRLAQGTEESAARMNKAIIELWKYTGDLLSVPAYSILSPEANNKISGEWNSTVKYVLSEAGISIPENVRMEMGGSDGKHTPHLGNLLQEMQFIQRTYPGVEW